VVKGVNVTLYNIISMYHIESETSMIAPLEKTYTIAWKNILNILFMDLFITTRTCRIYILYTSYVSPWRYSLLKYPIHIIIYRAMTSKRSENTNSVLYEKYFYWTNAWLNNIHLYNK